DVLVEPAEVVVQLCLSLSCGVNRDPQAGRPGAGEAVSHPALGAGISLDPLLLTADAEQPGQVLAHPPGVLGVVSAVLSECVEVRLAELATVLAQVDGHEHAAPADERTERA